MQWINRLICKHFGHRTGAMNKLTAAVTEHQAATWATCGRCGVPFATGVLDRPDEWRPRGSFGQNKVSNRVVLTDDKTSVVQAMQSTEGDAAFLHCIKLDILRKESDFTFKTDEMVLPKAGDPATPNKLIEDDLALRSYEAMSKPWYPDDSGEWVEFEATPDSKMPPELKGKRVEILCGYEREGKGYTFTDNRADYMNWTSRFCHVVNDQIVAYKIIPNNT